MTDREAKCRIGIDVGGTFTDIVMFDDDSGRIMHHKISSTPEDPSRACVEGISQILQRNDLSPRAVYSVIHGTTVATNALIQGKFAKLGLITTQGFRDVLEIANQTRPRNDLYNFLVDLPTCPIPRYLRREVVERLDNTGKVLTPLDESSVQRAVEELVSQGVGGIVISLLYSYINDAHEQRITELIAASYPDVTVSRSSAVLKEYREYERTVNTTLNASLMPVVGPYLGNLESHVADLGLKAHLYIMHSGGGMVSVEEAKNIPLRTALSGPAAGVVAAKYLGDLTGYKNILSFDMGGTSCDVSSILGGEMKLTTETELGGYPIKFPVVDVRCIGAGGGSIAWIDSGGALRVGPESAGAFPGPLCYGKGGELATVTDANLVLGIIDAAYFLGGELSLDQELAVKGIEQLVAAPLGLTLAEAAQGVIDVVNAKMARALKVISVQKGYDPREFVLVPFGGAGPMHSCAVADELGIPTILVPENPGTLSAFGLLTCDIKYDFTVTRLVELNNNIDPAELESIFQDMGKKGMDALQREEVRVEDMLFMRTVDLRYLGQSYELQIPLGTRILDEKGIAFVLEAFHHEHERQFGYSSPGEPVQLVTLRFTAVGLSPKPDLSCREEASPGNERVGEKGQRPVYIKEQGWVNCPVFNRSALPYGWKTSGPAVVEQINSTVFVADSYTAETDTYGNLLLRKKK